jgi:cyclopropane fatty-acyl-phospholipid synthase-like methyltransferase
MFARLGFTVIAVDISANAIGKLTRLANEQEVTLTTVLHDVNFFRIEEGEYDLVIAHGLLHWLRGDDGRSLVDRFKRGTRRGGYNVAVVVTNKLPLPAWTTKYCETTFDDGELLRYYLNWNTLLNESYSMPQTGRIPYPRHFNRIVARRMGNAS